MINHLTEFPQLKDQAILPGHLPLQQQVPPFGIRVDRDPHRRAVALRHPAQAGDREYVILLDDVIRYCLKDIFSIFPFDHFEAYTIKLTRDAQLDLDDDLYESYIEKSSKGLKQRRTGAPVRFI